MSLYGEGIEAGRTLDGDVFIESSRGRVLLTDAQVRWLLIVPFPALLAFKPDSEECAKPLSQKAREARQG